MSSNEVTLPSAAAAPERVGQATAVEQSRAIAEVQGAILVAQRCPRDVLAAAAAMRQSCNQKFLAERAFFEVPRAGGKVTGATIHLARELGRLWGNLQWGVSELRRDDVHGQSEMLAFAWDVQTNTRVETKFVVPHMRDRKVENGGPIRLTSMDDIYTSNANAGARRVRECLFSILPPWFVEEAKSLCYATLENGGGKPIEQRIADALRLFEENLDVTADQLENRIGRPAGKWTGRDVAQLSVTYQSLLRGEIEKEEAFPQAIVKLAERPAPEPAPATLAPADEDLHLVPDEDVPAFMAANNLVSEHPLPRVPDAPTGKPATEEDESAKASRDDIKVIAELLVEQKVTNVKLQSAVVSLLLDEKVAFLADLRVKEVRYLTHRIPELVNAGTFAGTVTRAAQAAGVTS